MWITIIFSMQFQTNSIHLLNMERVRVYVCMLREKIKYTIIIWQKYNFKCKLFQRTFSVCVMRPVFIHIAAHKNVGEQRCVQFVRWRCCTFIQCSKVQSINDTHNSKFIKCAVRSMVRHDMVRCILEHLHRISNFSTFDCCCRIKTNWIDWPIVYHQWYHFKVDWSVHFMHVTLFVNNFIIRIALYTRKRGKMLYGNEFKSAFRPFTCRPFEWHFKCFENSIAVHQLVITRVIQ